MKTMTGRRACLFLGEEVNRWRFFEGMKQNSRKEIEWVVCHHPHSLPSIGMCTTGTMHWNIEFNQLTS